MATSPKLPISLTDREPRGQTAIICRILQQQGGRTAAQILSATRGTTPHNSYSLSLIAERFGFKLTTNVGQDGLKRYQFVVPSRASKPKVGARKGSTAPKRKIAA